MFRKFLRSKTFGILFLAIFLALFFVASGIYIYLWHQNMTQSAEFSKIENEESMDAVCSAINGIFQRAQVTGKNLLRTEWVQKLSTNSKIFEKEFDYKRQKQIAGDFVFQPNPSEIESLKFLYFPRRDLCIGWNVWTNPRSYLGSLRVPKEDVDGILQSVQDTKTFTGRLLLKNPETLLLSVPVEETARPRCYLCFTVQIEKLSRYAEELSSNGIIGIQIMDRDSQNILMESGICRETKGIQLYLRPNSYIHWDCRFFVDQSLINISYKNNYLFVYWLAAVAVCAAIAFVMSYTFYKPVIGLMEHAGIIKQQHEWKKSDISIIENHITDISVRLKQEKRISYLHNLISGTFFREDALNAVGISFKNDQWFRVFICCPRAKTDDSIYDETWQEQFENFISTFNQKYEIINTVDSELILITAAENAADLNRISSHVIENFLEDYCQVFCGSNFSGLIGISLSYQSARDKIRRSLGLERFKYYLPLEWENQWMNALLNGHLGNTQEILSVIQRENERRLTENKITEADYDRLQGVLIEDLNRVVVEADLKGIRQLSELTELYTQAEHQKVWDGIRDMCNLFCELENQQENNDENENIPLKIIKYVEDHFDLHDLSLTSLSEEFGLSVNTVNKCIRQCSGMTFHSYLCKCRMQQAKILLEENKYRISDIADKVGYDNEYSFRRAFQQNTGVKAQNWHGDKSAASEGTADQSI